MKKLLLFIMAVVLASACTTTKYVEVPVVHTDTLIVTNHQKDSVWLHDSIYLHEWMKGDTVMVDRVVYHTKYQERLRTDTVYQHKTDTVAKPYPVEVKVEKELTWWQKTRIHAGEALLVLLALAVAVGIIKLVGIIKGKV
ncbi:MAG: hypothetical protein IKK92_03205 [Prevotella sp.]|nr:hypothetical protein [Prevotella sp.]